MESSSATVGFTATARIVTTNDDTILLEKRIVLFDEVEWEGETRSTRSRREDDVEC
jgi:hypothetical protein